MIEFLLLYEFNEHSLDNNNPLKIWRVFQIFLCQRIHLTKLYSDYLTDSDICVLVIDEILCDIFEIVASRH